MPDIYESTIHRGAGSSIYDPKVHEEFYSSIPPVAMRMEYPYTWKGAHGCVSLMS